MSSFGDKVGKLKKGDVLTAETINMLIAEVVRLGKITVGGGLSLQSTQFGVCISSNANSSFAFTLVKNDDEVWEKDTWKEVSIWSGNIGDETEDEADPIEVYNRWGDLTGDAWGLVFLQKQTNGENKWVLIQGSCE